MNSLMDTYLYAMNNLMDTYLYVCQPEMEFLSISCPTEGTFGMLLLNSSLKLLQIIPRCISNTRKENHLKIFLIILLNLKYGWLWQSQSICRSEPWERMRRISTCLTSAKFSWCCCLNIEGCWNDFTSALWESSFKKRDSRTFQWRSWTLLISFLVSKISIC